MKLDSWKHISYYLNNFLRTEYESNTRYWEQMTLDLHQAFRIGARRIAQEERKYTELHRAHGIEESHWLLLTQEEYWTPDQSRAIRSILANTVEVSMTIAGMPSIPLPGQYVAAVIAECVAPANRMLACTKAPDTFDATDASGLLGTSEIKEMTVQQMMSLVIAYSGASTLEPAAHKLPGETVEAVKKANESKRKKAMS